MLFASQISLSGAELASPRGTHHLATAYTPGTGPVFLPSSEWLIVNGDEVVFLPFGSQIKTVVKNICALSTRFLLGASRELSLV